MNTTPCEWFAYCDRPATGTLKHPVLGDTPCCDRCARRVGAEVTPFPAPLSYRTVVLGNPETGEVQSVTRLSSSIESAEIIARGAFVHSHGRATGELVDPIIIGGYEWSPKRTTAPTDDEIDPIVARLVARFNEQATA